jgi:hypothetical protein
VAAPAYMAMTEIALMELLTIAGAKGIRHRWLPNEPAGKQHGVDVVRVRREVSWE